jgi:hypothetical protein
MEVEAQAEAEAEFEQSGNRAGYPVPAPPNLPAGPSGRPSYDASDPPTEQ